MKRGLIVGAIVLGAVLAMASQPADARSRRYTRTIDPGVTLTEHPRAAYYRRGPQVRGFIARRGGYSYTYSDSIDTYGSPRTIYGSAPYARDPQMSRQTSAGPFDSGFFFDSGSGPRGGDSPYLH